MRKGAWYQFGHHSQKMVLEQLDHGLAVGAILSPRDLKPNGLADYAAQYRGKGVDVLIDPQFYIPDSTVGKLTEYAINQKYRQSISGLGELTDNDLGDLAKELAALNKQVGAAAIVAPAVLYEAGRPDIVELNARLFLAAKTAAHSLSIPVYATVPLGESVTLDDSTTDAALASATNIAADGWYFAFEFGDGRIPAEVNRIGRYLRCGLRLALTGKPCLHAFAGPLGLLSFAAAATGVAVGHSQNLWQFDRTRWMPTDAQGGGGDAPPRFFSTALWGTIVYPDELALRSPAVRRRVVVKSPYSESVSVDPPFAAWDRWDSYKHLLYMLTSEYKTLAAVKGGRDAAVAAKTILDGAVALHGTLAGAGIALKDHADAYQGNWLTALAKFLESSSNDLDYLELM